MKAAVYLALVLFAWIGVADTATARGLSPRPGSQQDSQAQNGFSEVELKAHGKRARSHHTVVVQLSHPQSAPHPTNPDGTPGRHTIPYEFPRTRVHRFCMQDDDGQRHRMVLTDAAGNHILSVTAGEECVTATIPAGRYTVTLHHDGSRTPSDVNTVFIRGHFEPVDDSVISSLTDAEPAPSDGPIIRAAADGYDAQCHSSDPDSVCCSYVDTWALQGSSGFYVTINNDRTRFDQAPSLSTVKDVDTQGNTTGATSPGKFELFEVFTCTVGGGTGPQLRPGTIFLSAPPGFLGGFDVGGFVSLVYDPPPYAVRLNPGNLSGTGDERPIDVFGGGICPLQLHLIKFGGRRQISFWTTYAERNWCTDGPLWGTEVAYVIEHADPYFLTAFDGDPARPIVALDDTSFFTPNRDFTILFVTGSCTACNLDGANLASYNLASALLSGASLQKANLAGANLSGADLSGGAKLQGATLSFAYMPDANLAGADLTGAHLDNVDLYQVTKRPSLNGATLYQTQFANANLIGIDLSNAHLEGADFSGAQMLDALLTGITHVSGLASGQVSFVNTLLAGANFSNSTFDGGDFTNAIFSTKSDRVDLKVRNSYSPSTTVTQPYDFGPTVRPLNTTAATVCPNTHFGPCATDAQWVAQDPPTYTGYNNPDDW